MILITGGAGFIGYNLIQKLRATRPKIKIVCLDNYFTGTKENHIDGVTYIEGPTWEAPRLLEGYKFNEVYHFGEYSRIVQSFKDIQLAQQSILYGTPVILDLCRQWGAKLIYSASSSKFGNNGQDENLAPYSWMKAKMVELIKNYHIWYGLQYEICYFFNVYGPGQIMSGDYATVIGIFERQWRAGETLTVVYPGTQTRDFTHVDDIVEGVLLAAQQQLNHEWYLRSGKNWTIIEVAELFTKNWSFIPNRPGERQHSTSIENDTSNRLDWYAKLDLKEWVNSLMQLHIKDNI